jgi:pentatricopeptide repeat protein
VSEWSIAYHLEVFNSLSLSEGQAGFAWKPYDGKILCFPWKVRYRMFQYKFKNFCIVLVYLLIVYLIFIGKSKDTDKALGLWTRMQEEDVQPSDEFLSALGNFLKEEGREVPFVIPEIVEAKPVADTYSGKKSHDSQETERALTVTQKFRQALRRNDLDDALFHKQM